jgi:5-methylcytosine-specific restriction endonuclease McrA
MPGRPRSRPPRRGRGPSVARPALTSSPTHRGAYDETRQWLLKLHGPVCAYCSTRVPVGQITLDHVTPRRGQTAYDRRDNLVLCCKPCNIAKADKSILAFLLGRRSRAISLYKYGQHLSTMLVDMARQFLPDSHAAVALDLPPAPTGKPSRSLDEMLEALDEGPSPYGDEESPYL